MFKTKSILENLRSELTIQTNGHDWSAEQQLSPPVTRQEAHKFIHCYLSNLPGARLPFLLPQASHLSSFNPSFSFVTNTGSWGNPELKFTGLDEDLKRGVSLHLWSSQPLKACVASQRRCVATTSLCDNCPEGCSIWQMGLPLQHTKTNSPKLRTHLDARVPNWPEKKDTNIYGRLKKKKDKNKPNHQSIPLNSESHLRTEHGTHSAFTNILALHQTFCSLTSVETERLQMWEGPLIYLPPCFRHPPVHIILEWQQRIIRLHVMYKIIAAVQNIHSERTSGPHSYTDAPLDFGNILLKITKGEEKKESVLSANLCL